MLEAAARLVLCIEIEKREWDFIGEKPLRQMNHEASLTNATLPTLSEHDSLAWRRHIG